MSNFKNKLKDSLDKQSGDALMDKLNATEAPTKGSQYTKDYVKEIKAGEMNVEKWMRWASESPGFAVFFGSSLWKLLDGDGEAIAQTCTIVDVYAEERNKKP